MFLYAIALVTIPTGAALQIDANTVVKFSKGGALSIASGATFDVYGQAGQEVIFTSVNDDLYGAIYPSSTGTPTIGDWSSISYAIGSLGSMAHAHVRFGSVDLSSTVMLSNVSIIDGSGLDIQAGSPQIDNLVIRNSGGINVWGGTALFNNISLAKTNGVNVYWSKQVDIYSGTISGVPVGVRGKSSAISVYGGTLNMDNVQVNGADYSLSVYSGGNGTFTNNTLNGAASEAVYIADAGVVAIDSSNIISNAAAPYLLNGYAPLMRDLYATLGSGIVDSYSVHVTGSFGAGNVVMGPDPLRTGSSVWLVVNNGITVGRGSRIQIDPYTILKFSGSSINIASGGVLDVYGQPGAEVIFTSAKDPYAGPQLSSGVPSRSDWRGITYSDGSSGNILFSKISYGTGYWRSWHTGRQTSVSSVLSLFGSTNISNLTIHDAGGGIGISPNNSAANIPINRIDNLTILNVVEPFLILGGTTVVTGGSIRAFPSNYWNNESTIYIHGASTNLTMSNMNISGGRHNITVSGGANATFTSNTFDGAENEAVTLLDTGTINMDASNIISNAAAPYLLTNAAGMLGTTLTASIIANTIADMSSVYLNGPFTAANTVLKPDPLNTGNSVWVIGGTTCIYRGISIGTLARVQIDPYTIIKRSQTCSSINVSWGGTLDIYGQPGAEVIFTNVNDDSVGAIILGSTGFPSNYTSSEVIFSGASKGSVFYLEDRYSIGITISESLPISNVSTSSLRLKGGTPTIDNVSLKTGLSVTGGSPVINNLSARVINVSGGSPLIHGGVIRGGIYYGINVSGTGANLTMDGVHVQGGQSSLDINGRTGCWSGGACKNPTGTFTNNIFEGAIGSAINITTMAAVTLRNNVILNSGSSGIDVTAIGAGAVIENNVIRGHANGGVSLASLTDRWGRIIATANNPLLRNNLIIENSSNPAAVNIWPYRVNNSGITVGAGASATLEFNTIANNVSSSGTNSAVRIDGTALLHDNIIASNFDSYGVPYDYYASLGATVSEYNNLTSDQLMAGVGDAYASPLFDANWYLQAASPAVNLGSLLFAGSASFMATNPYAEVTTVDTGTVDMGYHHAAPAVSVSPTLSTVMPASFINVGKVIVTVVVTPRDAAGNSIGAGLRMSASLGVSFSGAVIGTIRDMGDGSYQIDVDGRLAAIGQTDVITISVEGLGGPTPLTTTSSITW